jgi:uncharacterized protein YpmS
MKVRRPVFFILSVLVTASLACYFTGLRQEATPEPVPVTTEAVETLEENAQDAAQAFQDSGEINMEVTEEQLTSLVAFELQKQQDPVLQNPQVYLRDGQVQLRGDVQQGGIAAPLEMNMTVFADADGRPQYEVVSAKVGPFPLPQSILDQMTSQIDAVFASQFGAEAENIYIEQITIADGRMNIQGRPR